MFKFLLTFGGTNREQSDFPDKPPDTLDHRGSVKLGVPNIEVEEDPEDFIAKLDEANDFLRIVKVWKP